MSLGQAAVALRLRDSLLVVLALVLLPILGCDWPSDDRVFACRCEVTFTACCADHVSSCSGKTTHESSELTCPAARLSGTCPEAENLHTVVDGTTEERPGQEPKCPSSTGQKGVLKVIGKVANEFIVRFREYRHASDHRNALEQTLGESGWLWVERHNPALAFATDFAVLRIEDSHRESLLKQLADVNFVRDVSHQMQFTRALTMESRDGPLASHGETRKEYGGDSPGDGNVEAQSLKIKSMRQSNATEPERKRPGRLRTGMSYEDDQPWSWSSDVRNVSLSKHGRSLLLQRSQITSLFEADKLWAKGYSGKKVKMAVFDTGVRADHPHFRNIKERTNWTNEKDTLNDNLGHGTFVAGVISSQDPQCLGFAPDAEIYAFRVFTDAQVSYTSWFLDAFNYAIAMKMNVLNLSIGGPDYLDSPFIEKVWEMTANNIIMVSAIGNDGPLYGTLNNPADQSDVIGVGGIDYSDHIASFSSRGMSTWEIPHGYGRVKPDIVAYGREVIGSKISTGCKSLSGTSVASPVVAGAVCLLASVVPDSKRWEILNPASMKQALVEGATRLGGPNMYEQGAGRLNLLKSYKILVDYEPRASVMPSILDLTDCPYAWPFCRQPLYAGSMPVIFNATILNGMGVVGYVESIPVWMPSADVGHLLDIQFTYSDVIWPWTGYLGLHFRIKPEGDKFQGTLEGNVSFTVVSPASRGEKTPRRWDCTLPIKVAVIPTPPRNERILWDQFHSVRYPPGYIPRDSLDVRNDILDWHGDHLHTNFHGMFDYLRDAGYFLETLGSPLTCFDAENYGTLLMVDLEDEYYDEEIDKLKEDVESRGLGLIVFADWYHVETMVKMRFFDDNTRSWWTPATGGANVPSLNELLAPFGIAFGDTILSGAYSIGVDRAHYASGTDIQRFPTGGFVHRFLFQDTSGGHTGITSSRTAVKAQVESAILGAVEAGKGRISVYGDSNCLDSSHMVTNCYWLLKKLLDFTSQNIRDSAIFATTNELVAPLGGPDTPLPTRRSDVNFSSYSLVIENALLCGMDAPLALQGSKGILSENLKQRRREYSLNTSPSPLSALLQRQPMTSPSPSPLEELNKVVPQLSSSRVNQPPLEAHVDSAPRQTKAGSDENPPEQLEGTLMVKQVAFKGTSLDEQQELAAGARWGNGEALIKDKQDIDMTNSDVRRKTKKDLHFSLGWRSQDEFDKTNVVVQWLVPVLLCMTGFILIWSLWRVRQRKKRRARRGSA